MKSVKAIAICAAVALTGCASAYKNTYTVAAVTKSVVDEAHLTYSNQLNQQLNECDPQRNPDSKVTNKGELDECMGPAFKKDTVDAVTSAVSAYYWSSVVASAVLSGCEIPEKVEGEEPKPIDPKTCVKRAFTDDEFKEQRKLIIDSSIEFLELIPEGNKTIDKLKKLLPKR